MTTMSVISAIHISVAPYSSENFLTSLPIPECKNRSLAEILASINKNLDPSKGQLKSESEVLSRSLPL